MPQTAIPQPTVKVGINSFTYSWPQIGVIVDLGRVDESGVCEIKFWHNNGTGAQLLHFSKLNLLSATSCNQVAKRLKLNANIDWDTILTYVTTLTLESLRKGEPLENIGVTPEQIDIEYQLYPILEKNQPITIYGPGGSSKSYLAAYIACLVQFGVTGLELAIHKWIPVTGNVLYLDWESNRQNVNRRLWYIKRGLGIVDETQTILYRRCTQPLTSDLPEIQKIITDKNVALTIIDSQMAASSYGTDPAANASQYYNGLRSLNCTTLTIDHMAKIDWRGSMGENVGPYGSVVKFNRARSVFEVQKKQKPNERYYKLKLMQRKCSEGQIMDDIGIQVDFLENEKEKLDMITFSWFDPKKDEEFTTQEADLEDQILTILADGPLAVRQISKALDSSEGTIRTTLNRMVKKDKRLLYHDIKNGTWEIGETSDNP